MESLFNERLQIRTRQLQQQVEALNQRLHAIREQNLKLQQTDIDRSKQVQLLEEQLKTERDRCQKLSVTLSNCRRKKQTLQNGNHYCTELDCCGKELANYIKIMPAGINRTQQIKRDQQTTSRAGCPIRDSVQNRQKLAGSRNRQRKSAEFEPCQGFIDLHSMKHLHDVLEHYLAQCGITNGCSYDLSASNSVRNPEHPRSTIIYNHASNKHTVDLGKVSPSRLEDELEKQLENLNSGDFYLKMERSEPESVPVSQPSLFGDQIPVTMRLISTVHSLKTENSILRNALYSAKRLEISDLEIHLKDVKETASCRILNQNSSEAGEASNSYQMQVDPVKFLDTISEVEQRISEKNLAILGLECKKPERDQGHLFEKSFCIACILDHEPNCSFQGSRRLPNSVTGDEYVRDLLKVLARDIVLLREENLRLTRQLSREAI